MNEYVIVSLPGRGQDALEGERDYTLVVVLAKFITKQELTECLLMCRHKRREEDVFYACCCDWLGQDSRCKQNTTVGVH